jgi:hypothetical protein
VARGIYGIIFEIRGASWEGVEKGRGLFVKLEFPWINRIIFVLNNRWTRSIACGPCPAVVHGGPAVDSGTELTGAWPLTALVSNGANHGAGEGEWNAGNPMVHSPEPGRQRGSRATVVRAAAVRTPMPSVLGLEEWDMRGGDECGEKG